MNLYIYLKSFHTMHVSFINQTVDMHASAINNIAPTTSIYPIDRAMEIDLMEIDLMKIHKIINMPFINFSTILTSIISYCFK